MTEMHLEEVAGEATRRLIAGAGHSQERLREQQAAAAVDVERTGAGFFVHFDVPDAVDPIETTERVVVRGVSATVDGLRHGLEFLLFLDDGRLSMLEGYTHQEVFPTDTETLRGVQFDHSDDDRGASFIREGFENSSENLQDSLEKLDGEWVRDDENQEGD